MWPSASQQQGTCTIRRCHEPLCFYKKPLIHWDSVGSHAYLEVMSSATCDLKIPDTLIWILSLVESQTEGANTLGSAQTSRPPWVSQRTETRTMLTVSGSLNLAWSSLATKAKLRYKIREGKREKSALLYEPCMMMSVEEPSCSSKVLLMHCKLFLISKRAGKHN